MLDCVHRLGSKRVESSCGKGAGVSDKLGRSQLCPAPRRANPVQCPGGHQAQHCQPGQGGDRPVPLHWASLQSWGQLWASQYKKDIKFRGSPEECQEEVKDLEGKPYEEWLRILSLLSLEEIEGRVHCGLHHLFTLVTSDRTWRNGMKLSQGGLGWISRKNFSPRVAGHQNRFPREVVRAPSPAWAQEEFGQHSQALGGILRVSCSGLRVGLKDPDGSLPIQHILWIVETIFILEERGFLQLQNSIKYNFLQFWCVQGITQNARLSHRYYSKLLQLQDSIVLPKWCLRFGRGFDCKMSTLPDFSALWNETNSSLKH